MNHLLYLQYRSLTVPAPLTKAMHCVLNGAVSCIAIICTLSALSLECLCRELGQAIRALPQKKRSSHFSAVAHSINFSFKPPIGVSVKGSQDQAITPCSFPCCSTAVTSWCAHTQTDTQTQWRQERSHCWLLIRSEGKRREPFSTWKCTILTAELVCRIKMASHE